MLTIADVVSNMIDRPAFAACSNDYARINYLFNCPEFITLLNQPSTLLDEQKNFLKSAQQSTDYREKGNAAYSSRNDQLALSLYNQAVRYAPSYSKELSLALGNRSAVLFNLKYYQLALDDIHRALDLLSLNDEDEQRRQRLEQRLHQCLQNRSETLNPSSDDFDRLENELKQIKSNHTFNENYPSLTNYADIRESKERGRHVVSKTNSSTLKPGTIILVEQPYASVLLPSAWSTHCHQCFRRLNSVLFACSQCTRAIYCSFDCLQTALMWHAFECRLDLENLEKMELLAFRLITKTGWQYLLKHKNHFEDILQRTSTSTSTTKEVYQWNNYENILTLETNNHRRTADDLFNRSVQACILGLSLVNNTSFCQDAYDNKNYQIYLCSLFLSHLQSLPCNAHEISEFIYHQAQPLTSSCLEIGAGIYATLSLFNHSCSPNVIRNFIGDTVVVRLLGSITDDDQELLDNYGCLSAMMDKTERQNKLSEQYRFQCQCQPCVDQWPKYDQLPDGTGPKKIPSNIFDRAFQRLITGARPTRDDLTIFEEFLARCDEEMSDPKLIKGKVYNNAQEAYKQCLNFFSHSIHTED